MTLARDVAVCLNQSIAYRSGMVEPTIAGAEDEHGRAGAAGSGPAFRVEVFDDPTAVLGRWRALADRGRATPFQTIAWYTTWMDTIGAANGAEPVIVIVADAAGDRLLLPLVRRRDCGRRVIEFPDLGVSDYNAPVFDPALAVMAGAAPVLWRAVRAALPAADLVRFEKMPVIVEGSANPLAGLAEARPIELECFAVPLPESFDAYRAETLAPKIAKELTDKRRRYQGRSGQAFSVVDNSADAERVFAALVAQRKARFAALGRAEILDDPVYHTFYRRLAVDHAADGFMVLSATEVAGRPAACSYAVRHGKRVVQLLSSTEDDEWARFSTGRLISDYTIEWAIDAGCDVFDFSIGDESYKLGFGARPGPMARLEVALSPRGWPVVWRSAMADFVRAHPTLRNVARRLRDLVGG